MISGWHDNTYLILFEQAEAITMTDLYGMPEVMSGFTVVGLRGWNDFIVRDFHGRFFTVPTVPMSCEHLETFNFRVDLSAIQPDDRIGGKIKWHVTPLIFGGNPTADENVAWISLEDHVNAVRWWNHKYREIKAGETSGGNGG